MSFTSTLLGIVIGGAVFGTPSPSNPAEFTIVSGVVYAPDGTPVNGGTVNVLCGSGTQTVSILPDGSYQATFPQTECKNGNTASSNASTAEGNGANSAPVKDTPINGPSVNIDVAVVNINLAVPEFGTLTGLLSLAGASGAFLYQKYKAVTA